jgi:hypothetical protein
MNPVHYCLADIPGFTQYLSTGTVPDEYKKYYDSSNYTTKEDRQKYQIVKYKKEYLASDIAHIYGLLRSVIVSAGHVVCFSPPKSLSAEQFMSKYPDPKSIVAEEFVEGTMINVFYNYGLHKWEIATKSTVGGDVKFFKDATKTFRQMFEEACVANNLALTSLNPEYCYSFVLQHPENRIVVPFKTPQLYIVGIYQIFQNGSDINAVYDLSGHFAHHDSWKHTSVKFPAKYEFNSYTELLEKYASPNTPFDVVGVMVKNQVTGERTKFRNPVYEEVRQLRGNQPKLQFQYLTLRHSGRLPDFLKFYPEAKPQMSQFRDQVHMYTRALHQNYLACYVRKEKPLNQFPAQYRTHMYKIHEVYLNELRPQKLFVTDTVVMKYVNELPPTLLMHCLNYNYKVANGQSVA